MLPSSLGERIVGCRGDADRSTAEQRQDGADFPACNHFPGNSMQTAALFVSVLEEPLVVFSNTVNVTFKGIKFFGSRGLGLLLEKTRNTTIQNCIFNNIGTVAISTGNQFVNKRKVYLDASANYRPIAHYNVNLVNVNPPLSL